MDPVWALVEATPGARERVDAHPTLKRLDGEAEKRQVLAHVLRVGGHDARTVRQVYDLAPGQEFMVCVQLCLRARCAEVREAVARGQREYATALASLAIRAGD
jgi:hypothetical protein